MHSSDATEDLETQYYVRRQGGMTRARACKNEIIVIRHDTVRQQSQSAVPSGEYIQ